MKRLSLFLLPAIALGLSGCGSEQPVRLGPQGWQDLEFIVEARPTPIRAGMTEFIVIASREKVKPGVGIIVSLRVDDKTEWKQAIQDGYTGVYRRAIKVINPQTDILAVQVRNAERDDKDGENETILYFPLSRKQE